ncbi:MAG: hypothetical protein G8345_18495 [Magnetococcales bacterium]|nr:hypothetical protein [Magnetococcales bacterium]
MRAGGSLTRRATTGRIPLTCRASLMVTLTLALTLLVARIATRRTALGVGNTPRSLRLRLQPHLVRLLRRQSVLQGFLIGRFPCCLRGLVLCITFLPLIRCLIARISILLLRIGVLILFVGHGRLSYSSEGRVYR